jgi:hypothetical protein
MVSRMVLVTPPSTASLQRVAVAAHHQQVVAERAGLTQYGFGHGQLRCCR